MSLCKEPQPSYSANDGADLDNGGQEFGSVPVTASQFPTTARLGPELQGFSPCGCACCRVGPKTSTVLLAHAVTVHQALHQPSFGPETVRTNSVFRLMEGVSLSVVLLL